MPHPKSSSIISWYFSYLLMPLFFPPSRSNTEQILSHVSNKKEREWMYVWTAVCVCVCVSESARAMLTIAVGSIFRAFFFFSSWPRLNRVMHSLASPPPPWGFPAQRVNSGSLKLRHTSTHSSACTGTDRNVRGWVSTCTHSLHVFSPVHSELLGLDTVEICNKTKLTNLSSLVTLHPLLIV